MSQKSVSLKPLICLLERLRFELEFKARSKRCEQARKNDPRKLTFNIVIA